MVVDRRFAAFAVSRMVLFRTGRATALAVSHIGRRTAMQPWLFPGVREMVHALLETAARRHGRNHRRRGIE